jgi:CubicO group peptidase (beta-lactamase class C family)
MRTLIILFLSITTGTFGRGADDTAQKVNQLFAAFDKAGSPGCSIGVISNGSFVFEKSYGYASLELGVPLTPGSVFYMGSVSKQFTAASIVLAAEQGYLSLDDDVHKYLSELPNYGHPVTLRQMMHQTSGFRDLFDLIYLSGLDPKEIESPTDVLKLIARQKGLNNAPGAEWVYSNSNYFLLAEVIQRATKKSLAQFAAENIFQPLGMVHTLFYDDNTLVVSNRVAAYDPGKHDKFLVDWSTTYQLVGGGGLMSNVDDLRLWDRNFYSNKLGKGTLLRELESHGVLSNGNQINYAMGLDLGDYRGLPTVEHGGALFGYRTEFLRFPHQRFSVMVLCNLSSANPEILARKVADLYLEGDFAATTGESHPSQGFPDPAAFAGTYIDPRTKTIYKFTADRGDLIGWGEPLRRIDANRFYDLGSGVITFDYKNDGDMRASLHIPGELYFSGDRIQPLHLSVAEIGRFTGNFHSEELDTTYMLSVEQGRLTIKKGNNAMMALDAVTQDEFYSSDLGTIVFHTDANHHVSGFNLSTQQARGIVFTRLN